MIFDKLHKYTKYVGAITMLIPIFIFFNLYTTLFVYIVGIFVNIFVNYLLKISFRQLPPLYQKKNYVKKIMEKYNKKLDYEKYALPSEKIQNISYAIGFIATYVVENYNSVKNELHLFLILIIFCYILTAATGCILYFSLHSSIIQMITGKIVGLILGVGFYNLARFLTNSVVTQT